MHIKTTKKRKTLVALPGEYMSKVYIPNHITEAHYCYTLMQERIFNYVMYYLQGYIAQVRAGVAIKQLDMFKTDADQNINITVPLMMISKPQYYDRVRASAIALATIIMKVPKKDKNGSPFTRHRGLFTYVDIPRETDRTVARTGNLTLQMSRDVAEMLVDVEIKNGIPQHYTTFLFEVAMDAQNKYTPRIYKMISSYKKKGGFYISYDELRERLGIAGNKYKNYAAFKKSILEPVHKELMNKADCWFNFDDANFLDKKGKKVVGFRFKVINPELSLHYVKLKESIINLLRMHFNMKQEHIDQLAEILNVPSYYDTIQYKILELNDRIRTDKTIHNKQLYIVKALQNAVKQ